MREFLVLCERLSVFEEKHLEFAEKAKNSQNLMQFVEFLLKILGNYTEILKKELQKAGS